MFSIKLIDCDIWVGKKNISYFIKDDSYFTFTKQNNTEKVSCFGVPPKRKRTFSSTDQIRRSLRSLNKETVVKSIVLDNGITCDVLVEGNSLGKFSNYVIVDLVNGDEYSLDDVLSGLI